RVMSKDAANNLATSSDAPFTTLDTTAPVITGVSVSAITGSGATISWTTTEAATRQEEYATTTNYATSSTLDMTLGTSHTVTLTGFPYRTRFRSRVMSKDAANNLATSSDGPFTTLDTTAPVISGVAVSAITGSGATITWTTTEAAT